LKGSKRFQGAFYLVLSLAMLASLCSHIFFYFYFGFIWYAYETRATSFGGPAVNQNAVGSLSSLFPNFLVPHQVNDGCSVKLYFSAN
jgi:hypothetical protein